MDAPADWFPRRMAAPLVEAMTDTPVVCLLGPRQCGKSTLARRAFPDRPYYSFDDDTLRDRAASDPRGFVEADWLNNLDRFGHLLESFVVQQLMAQAGWTDPDLRFWHYRDKDQVEVDLVITRGRETWGIEVKAAATLAPSDGQGLRRLAEQCGRHFRGGMILHAGASLLPTANSRVLAVPLSELWTR